MNKSILTAACIMGMSGVLLGAFAAHGLRDFISSEAIATFETGVRYQIYYAIVLLVVGFSNRLPKKVETIILYFSVIGILLFSGSIYGLATNQLTGFNFKTIGFITPIGGLLLIGVWAIMLISIVKQHNSKP